MKRTEAVFGGREALWEEQTEVLQLRYSCEQRTRSCLVSSLTLSLLHPFSKYFLDQLLCPGRRCSVHPWPYPPTLPRTLWLHQLCSSRVVVLIPVVVLYLRSK